MAEKGLVRFTQPYENTNININIIHRPNSEAEFGQYRIDGGGPTSAI